MSVAEEVNLDKQQLLDLRLEQYYVPDPVDLDDEYIRNIQKQLFGPKPELEVQLRRQR